MAKMILQAKLALEQIILRMQTVTELGDVAVTLLPVVSIVNEVKSGMNSINPMAERELGDIGNLLNGIVVDATMLTGMDINFESLSEDSSKILDEAQTIAETKMNETFPTLPDTNLSRAIPKAI
jgi:division protein CdvB (Snf7/Vps24/ESCRT-III family)